MDLVAYDCGVQQGEFKEQEGRVERIKELIKLLGELPESRKTTFPKEGPSSYSAEHHR